MSLLVSHSISIAQMIQCSIPFPISEREAHFHLFLCTESQSQMLCYLFPFDCIYWLYFYSAADLFILFYLERPPLCSVTEYFLMLSYISVTFREAKYSYMETRSMLFLLSILYDPVTQLHFN